MNEEIKGVLLDMDGVLVATEWAAQLIWFTLSRTSGIQCGPRDFRMVVSAVPDDAKAMVEEKFGPEFPYRRFKQLRHELLDEFISANGVPVKRGAFELLQALEDGGVPRAVATTSPRAEAEMFLHGCRRNDNRSLSSFLSAVVTREQFQRGKPEPDVYFAGAAALGLPVDRCAAIEDSWPGVLSALRAGCSPVIVIPDVALLPDVLPRDEHPSLIPAADLHQARQILREHGFPVSA